MPSSRSIHVNYETLAKTLRRLQVNPDKEKFCTISNIFVADDLAENLSAAKKLEQKLPDITVSCFNSGKEICEAIIKNPAAVDLVLTDCHIEKPFAGIDVIEEAWQRQIPALVVSGGKGHVPVVVIDPFLDLIIENGDKKDPEIWGLAIQAFAQKATDMQQTNIFRVLLEVKRSMGKTAAAHYVTPNIGEVAANKAFVSVARFNSPAP